MADSSSFTRKMALGISTQRAGDASVWASDSFIFFKPTSHTSAFAKREYNSFLESLHVVHSIRNEREETQSSLRSFLLFSSRPFMAVWFLNDLDSMKLIYSPRQFATWPRAIRNGDRIFHLPMLVTPKPHRIFGAAQSLLQNLLLQRRWLDEWRKYDVFK